MEAYVLDAIVIILLVTTIVLAYRLDRRLQNVRAIQADLSQVIRELNVAATRAEAGIQGLRVAAQSTGLELDEQIRRARNAGDELSNLLELGDRVGRKLEERTVPPASVSKASPRPAFDALRAIGGFR